LIGDDNRTLAVENLDWSSQARAPDRFAIEVGFETVGRRIVSSSLALLEIPLSRKWSSDSSLIQFENCRLGSGSAWDIAMTPLVAKNKTAAG